MNELLDLEPSRVLQYFTEISKYPRGSKNEKAVSDYIVALAKEKGWGVVQDNLYNVILKKGGTAGYEASKPVVLQGHLDMVCVKEEASEHDFLNDPIELVLKGEELYANGTTLGADNGVAVAMALALLDSDDIPHPPLEVILTIDEESGMTGAEGLDLSSLEGRTLINLDSEDFGVFTVGSAGGAKCKINVPLEKTATDKKEAYTVAVKGLFGGHSGVDIPKERGNAIKLLVRLMNELKVFCDFTQVSGGDFDNAIPTEAHVTVLTDDKNRLNACIDQYRKIFTDELKVNDPQVDVFCERSEAPVYVYTKETTGTLIATVSMIPSGVIERSTEIDLVITSNNLGVVEEMEDKIQLVFAPRSSVDTKLKYLLETIELSVEAMGAEMEAGSFYPGWAFNSSSKILATCKGVFKKMYNKEPKVEAIHAGLECGFFLGKLDGLDAISIGPNMADLHTANEHVNIPSLNETYEFLKAVLKEMK